MAAGASIGAFAFAVGAATVPAQAATATDTGVHVEPASPVWHYIGNYQSASACHADGRRYMDNDWGVRYECRPDSRGQYDLWVLTDI